MVLTLGLGFATTLVNANLPEEEAMTKIEILTGEFPEKYLRAYGNFTLAYSLYKDENIRTLHVPDLGVIGFGDYKNRRIVVADPLCDRRHVEELTNIFIDKTKNDGKIGRAHV